MPQPRLPDGPGRWPRRRVLVVGALGLAGCTLADPRIQGSGRPPPTSPSSAAWSRPTPDVPGAATDAEEEQALAELCAAVRAGPHRARLTQDERAALEFLATAHSLHGQALRDGILPTGTPSPVSPGPAAVGAAARLPGSRGLALIARREAATATSARAAALAATGTQALLWGSLAVAAGSYQRVLADPGGARLGPARAGSAVARVSDVEAVSQVLQQVHALIYGYQVALGRLPVLSRGHRRALTGLAQHRDLRGRLTADLVKRAVEVPAAEPAYLPPVTPRDSTTAASLIRRMETAFLPFCGLWLAAAATLPDRRLALDTLAAAEARAGSWRAPPLVWPGWVTR